MKRSRAHRRAHTTMIVKRIPVIRRRYLAVAKLYWQHLAEGR